SEASQRLAAVSRELVRAHVERVGGLDRRLGRAAPGIVGARRERLGALVGRLDAMSPLKVLARGYAIVTRSDDGRAVRDSHEVVVGDALCVRVAHGSFEAAVTKS